MGQWYCAIGDRQLGPLPAKALRKMVRDGELGRQDLIRQGEDGTWVPACRVKGLFDAAAKSAPDSPATSITEPVPTGPPPAPTLKRAQPLVKPPVPQAAPRPPVAAPPPLAAPPIVPDSGTARSVAPVQGVPAIGALPVGTPVVAPVIAPARFAEQALTGESSVSRPHRRKSLSPKLLTGVLGGVIVLVGIVGAVVWSMDLGNPAVGENTAPARSAAGEGGILGLDAEDIELASVDGEPAAVTVPGAIEQPSAVAVADPRLEQVMREVDKWRDASSLAGLQFPGLMSLKIVAAWLESDLAQADAPDDGGLRSETSENQYLIVKVSITNTAPDRVLTYNSWNGSGDNGDLCAAAVQDATGAFGRLVPVDEARLAQRQSNVSLQPGSDVEDVLVFAVSAAPSDFYRLALPRAAVGRTKSIGFELPRVMLRKPVPAEVAESTPAPAPAADSDAAVTEPIPTAAASPTTDPAITVTAKDSDAEPAVTSSDRGGQPSDLRGLLDSIKASKTETPPDK